ncbi:hypothetical protein [Endozoicomonas arenosclerae]|uniref:hypothetical protein n=1 Tax=Endozoicomonas arenosclerae TaxID=1633495 RepID=UPI0007827EF9|nr:hypothetical protein [Endozoicomonas arenosclerae]
MKRRQSYRIKEGCTLEERHELACMEILNGHIWVCVYHYHRTKGVLIGEEPPNDSWPTSNRKSK